MTRFVVYDVFTETAFGGNQLAVIPDATAVPEALLQKIAREFNFSESTFVYPPDDPGNTAKVRIFTPTMEVPFAGHPTIGTATALRDDGVTGDLILELGIGPVPCTFGDEGASFTISAPLTRFGTPDVPLVAAALSLPETAITSSTHPPTQAGVGLPFLFVELASREALASCQPVTDIFRQGAERYPCPLDFAIYAYVREKQQIDARMFAPLDNIPEDPATGSAAAAVAALLADITKQEQDLTISQGEDMGRPSHIHATTSGSDPVTVTVAGRAVKTMEGQLVF